MNAIAPFPTDHIDELDIRSLSEMHNYVKTTTELEKFDNLICLQLKDYK